MKAARSDALTQALLDFNGKSTVALERFAAAQQPDASLSPIYANSPGAMTAIRKRRQPGCSSDTA